MSVPRSPGPSRGGLFTVRLSGQYDEGMRSHASSCDAPVLLSGNVPSVVPPPGHRTSLSGVASTGASGKYPSGQLSPRAVTTSSVVSKGGLQGSLNLPRQAAVQLQPPSAAPQTQPPQPQSQVQSNGLSAAPPQVQPPQPQLQESKMSPKGASLESKMLQKNVSPNKKDGSMTVPVPVRSTTGSSAPYTLYAGSRGSSPPRAMSPRLPFTELQQARHRVSALQAQVNSPSDRSPLPSQRGVAHFPSVPVVLGGSGTSTVRAADDAPGSPRVSRFASAGSSKVTASEIDPLQSGLWQHVEQGIQAAVDSKVAIVLDSALQEFRTFASACVDRFSDQLSTEHKEREQVFQEVQQQLKDQQADTTEEIAQLRAELERLKQQPVTAVEVAMDEVASVRLQLECLRRDVNQLQMRLSQVAVHTSPFSAVTPPLRSAAGASSLADTGNLPPRDNDCFSTASGVTSILPVGESNPPLNMQIAQIAELVSRLGQDLATEMEAFRSSDMQSANDVMLSSASGSTKLADANRMLGELDDAMRNKVAKLGSELKALSQLGSMQQVDDAGAEAASSSNQTPRGLRERCVDIWTANGNSNGNGA